MPVFPQQFAVPYRFDVHFTRDVFAGDNDTLAQVMQPRSGGRPARALVYIDAGTVKAHPKLVQRIHAWFTAYESRGVQLAASPEVVTGGEALKGELAILDKVGREAFDNGICRHSYVIIIGGGAVLDAVGFAASLVHRGIRQIRLPTTVLGQCDAGLGVKNGVNRFGSKNFYGTFTPPFAIINDARFLESLDDRSWRAGIAEAVKVATIKDAVFLDRLTTDAAQLRARDLPTMEYLVQRCALIHLEHITTAGDPFEQGSSRPLDYGHWSAHRMEVLSQHRLLHGEAVAIGVAIDTLYAVELGRITRSEADQVLGILTTVGFRLWDEVLELRDSCGKRAVLAGLAQFREHLGGELTLAMPLGLGKRSDIYEFDEALFERALAQLRRFRPQPVGQPTAKG